MDKDQSLRIKIVELTSKLLDNPDKNGIYATTKFYKQLEKYILLREERIKIAAYHEGMKAKFKQVKT
jgi:hypothetical protein